MFSVWHDFGIWVSSVSQIMCLHFPTNKGQLVSFRSLKNYHVLAFWLIIPPHQSWSQVCLSPLTHTWLIESRILSWPCHLVLIWGGLTWNSLSFYCQFLVTTIFGWRPACCTSFPHNPANVSLFLVTLLTSYTKDKYQRELFELAILETIWVFIYKWVLTRFKIKFFTNCSFANHTLTSIWTEFDNK